MLKLYNLNKTLIRGLKNTKDEKVESVLATGDKTLTFLWKPEGAEKIPHEYYIRTDADEFVVKENSKGNGGFRSIVAKLNIEDIEGRAWQTFECEQRTAQECADMALVDTGWRCVSTIGDKIRSFQLANVNSYSVFEKICEAFTCERKFDTINKVVYLADRIGGDKGTYFMSGLNLRELSDSGDTYDYFTRIIPIGENGATIEGINDGKKYLENNQYSDKVKTIIWEDTSYTDLEWLKEDAEYKLNELSKPRESYSAKIVDFAKLKPSYDILSYAVGDTVTLIDGANDIRKKQRIVKTVEYLHEPNKNTCEIANTVLSFEDMQKSIKGAMECINNVTNGSGIVIGSKVEGMQAWQIGGLEAYIANSSEIADLKAKYMYVSGELGAVKASIGEIYATYLKATDAEIKYATIQQADILDANIRNLSADYGGFKVVVTEDVSAVKASIGEIYATYLKATDAEIKYATIQQADILDANIRNLSADYGDFKAATVEEFRAVNASVEELGAKMITAEYLTANYAKIDLANIQAGSIKTAMIEQGAVGTAQIANGSITDAKIVELTANKITAGTLSVERLEIRGSEKSIMYELNNVTGALQAKNVNTLNGEVLTPRSITADRIVANAITATEIAAKTITANNIASNTITATEIAANSITAAEIASGTITATEIAASAVTADKIDVRDLFAQDIMATGTITGADLKGSRVEVKDYLRIVSEEAAKQADFSFSFAPRLISYGGTWGEIDDGYRWIEASSSGYTFDVSAQGFRSVGEMFLKTANIERGNIKWLASYEMMASTLRTNVIEVEESIACNGDITATSSDGEEFTMRFLYIAVKSLSEHLESHGHANLVLQRNGTTAVTYDGKTAKTFNVTAASIGAAAATHAHSIAEVTNLQATLNGKAASSHTHTIANITNLQTTLNGKAASSHAHNALTGTTSGTVTLSAQSSYLQPSLDGGTSCGSSNHRWSRVFASNATISTSDENEKRDMKPIDERYEKMFMSLRPITYKWKNLPGQDRKKKHDRTHCGLGAQTTLRIAREHGLDEMSFAAICRDELEEKTIDGRTERYGIAYSELHGLEIHMIQLCMRKIEELTSQIKQLEQLKQGG